MRMSNRFTILRHGESEANKKRILAGRTLTPPPSLTNLGFDQASEAGDQYASDRSSIKRVDLFVSTLLRTRQTAANFAARLGVAGIAIDRIIYDERLEEYDAGSFTGRPTAFFKNTLNWHEECPDAETMSAFAGRIALAFTNIIEHYDSLEQDSGLVVVGHAGTVRVIRAIENHISPDDIYGPNTLMVPNAGLNDIDVEMLRNNLEDYIDK